MAPRDEASAVLTSPSGTRTLGDCRLLGLPLELRDRIYKDVISPKQNKTPKKLEKGLRSSTRYDWNIDPVILRLNRQISLEAKEVLARENKFVAIERSQVLQQVESDFGDEDPGMLVFNISLWPGKASKNVNVPGERMRVRLLGAEEETNGSDVEMGIHVMLVEELRDFCSLLSISQRRDGGYRTSGLSIHIRLCEPRYKEAPQEQDEMRTLLLKSLAKLRHLRQVNVEGMAPLVVERLLEELKQTSFDRGLILSTMRELILNGDCACDSGLRNIATVYYQRAHDYLHHFDRDLEGVFKEDLRDVPALEFQIMQHRALNWIEDDNYRDAFGASDNALTLADRFISAVGPETDGPPSDAEGMVTKDAFMQWTCQRIKEGAEMTGQSIRAEDIARCFYYRSISGQIVGGKEATAQANHDKWTGLACFIMSDTVADKAVLEELVELEKRTMERLMEYSKRYHKDTNEDGEDDCGKARDVI